ncbi:retinoid isomerohydrolase-like [Babylonia areolata]|uniref:retinoid isomerohydrolase-like n=1 Tax=Babylonia areolata TaxID=304850 RepID=UPI003FD26456
MESKSALAVVLTVLVLLERVEEQGERGEERKEGQQGEDPGFHLFFQSNREEMLHVAIRFDPPLPVWLCGTLVRNGLGLFENGDRTFLHAFDGFAKLSSWSFYGNGTATFSTRFLGSSFYNDSMASGTISPYLLFEGPTPPFDLLERLQALLRGLDNMNVNVYSFPGDDRGEQDYVALSDYWKAYRFSPLDLSTGRSVTGVVEGRGEGKVGEVVSGASFLDLLSSAHPLPEPGTGHHLTFLSSVSVLPFVRDRLQLVRIRSTTEREVVAAWPVDRVPYMHSFSVTASHALLLAHPFYVSVSCMVYEATPFNCLEWSQHSPSALYVVELRTGKVVELSMENVFTMHHINAYDAGPGRIVMDISAYPDPSFVGSLRLSTLRDPVARNAFPAHAHLQRYHVDLVRGTVTRVHLTPPSPAFISYLDMPTLNERFRSRRYCFVYGLVLKTDNETLSHIAIVKRDVCGKGGDRFWLVPHHYPVEPVFVPHPQGVEEDEGVVLVPMIDGPSGRSYMAVLDARDLRVVSRAVLPTLVPYSLHGRFFQHVV